MRNRLLMRWTASEPTRDHAARCTAFPLSSKTTTRRSACLQRWAPFCSRVFSRTTMRCRSHDCALRAPSSSARPTCTNGPMASRQWVLALARRVTLMRRSATRVARAAARLLRSLPTSQPPAWAAIPAARSGFQLRTTTSLVSEAPRACRADTASCRFRTPRILAVRWRAVSWTSRCCSMRPWVLMRAIRRQPTA